MAVYLNRTGDLTDVVLAGDVLNYTLTKTNPYIVLPPGEYLIKCWGGKGGDGSSASSTGSGSHGGYSYGTLRMTAAEELYLAVGGKGANLSPSSHSDSSGGYNGGGTGQYHEFRVGLINTRGGGGGGGGASHVAFRGGLLSSLSTHRGDVIIVAGGGGGGSAIGSTIGDGGPGGGESGGNPTAGDSDEPAMPGTHDSGGIGGLSHSGRAESGNFGRGGNGVDAANYQNQCGGGGGWYGGGAGNHCGGGGGSGYVSSTWLTDADTVIEDVSTNPDTSGNGVISFYVAEVYKGLALLNVMYDTDLLVEDEIVQGEVAYTYDDVTGVVPDTGDVIAFRCSGKMCSDDIAIGDKTLKCAGKLMESDVIAWLDPI